MNGRPHPGPVPGRWQGCLLLVLVALTGTTQAHEVRPAYLEIEQVSALEYRVLWKQPLLGDRRLPIDPVLPESCTTGDVQLPENTGTALIERWSVACDLTGGAVHIAGLSQTLTDVMVTVRYLDGTARSELLRADAPSLDLGDPAPPLASYLTLGIEHLLSGIDHLLFVIGLVLLIRDPWMLLKTVTAFTLAHSLTLGLSVLGLVTLSQRPVEAVIALSILFLARELLIDESRRSAVMRLRPWLMAFIFGLLHGFGFAGALSDIGLPRNQFATSLLLFNLGIELGQLLVIAVLLISGWLLRRVPGVQESIARHAFTFVMGAMAAYWTIDRVWLVL